ncbi:MAG: sensor domain-containing protein, partial [Solirubrobacteraceae bacterium]
MSPLVPAAAGRLQRAAADAAYLLLGLVAGAVCLVAWVAGVGLSLTLGSLIAGFPVVLGTFVCFRALADLERRRAALVLGAPLPSEYRPTRGRLALRLKTMLHDPQRWRDTLYIGLIAPVGVCKGLVALALWTLAIGGLTMPAWWWALPAGVDLGLFTIDTWAQVTGAVAAAAALFPLAALATRGMARSEASMARALLAPSLAAR